METSEQAIAPKSGPSMILQIGLLLVMTAVAVGIGWLSGGYLNGTVPHDPAAEAKAASATDQGHGTKVGHGKASDAKGGKGDAETEAPADPLVLALAPITTNIAAPSDVWLRIELSVVLDAPSANPDLAGTIHQDLLAFLRTIKMHQIEGASGFQHLKADLTERAAIRSDGHVKAVLIKVLLFE